MQKLVVAFTLLCLAGTGHAWQSGMSASGSAASVVHGVAREHPPVLSESWASFLAQAGAKYGEEGSRAAGYLLAHRPERDEGLGTDLLMSNLDFALRARRGFPWAADVPEALFLNDVLPYAVLDETREDWRPGMYALATEIVEGSETIEDATQALNRKLFNRINVHYNTGRKRPNQSPSESVAQGRATCTGLSIILVDACRAVGIPARVAGVAEWAGKGGNHTWVEVWDGERWRFTGADEYNKNGLDRGWFVRDASRAIAGHERFAVWASSWGERDDHFPMVWNPEARDVYGVDVTARYSRPHNAGKGTEQAGLTRYLRLWESSSGARIVAEVRRVALLGESCDPCDLGSTRGPGADLNDMPSITVPRAGWTTIEFRMPGDTEWTRTTTVWIGDQASGVIDLYADQLGLTAEHSERILDERWSEAKTHVKEAFADELAAGAVKVGKQTLRIKTREFGDAPEGGRSLWISMHGGGGAPAEVNDRQWENQIRLYEPAEGVYVAPRAPTDTWNLWHKTHIDGLFDRLIAAAVVMWGVDPNRVYLMGYSAGGDGVYQLAPRMADRFAAAAMMAGHPNETSPLGLRNLPFAIFMGGEDSAYNRNGIAKEFGDRLAELQRGDPAGYPHKVSIYPGLGHWMDRKDTEALPWMASQTRIAWPDTVVWHQDDVTHTRFSWLAVEPGEAKPRTTVIARVLSEAKVPEAKVPEAAKVGVDTGATSDADAGHSIIEINTAGAPELRSITLRLRDELLPLDRPMVVRVNGAEKFRGVVGRTVADIERSLAERLDPRTAATAHLTVRW